LIIGNFKEKIKKRYPAAVILMRKSARKGAKFAKNAKEEKKDFFSHQPPTQPHR
jgi:hypothetical protein